MYSILKDILKQIVLNTCTFLRHAHDVSWHLCAARGRVVCLDLQFLTPWLSPGLALGEGQLSLGSASHMGFLASSPTRLQTWPVRVALLVEPLRVEH